MEDGGDHFVAAIAAEDEAEQRGTDQDEEDHAGDVRGTGERRKELTHLAQDEQAGSETREEDEAGEQGEGDADGIAGADRLDPGAQVHRVAQEEDRADADEAGEDERREAALGLLGEAQASEQDCACRADGSGFCRRGDAAEDGAEHGDDQDQRRTEAEGNLLECERFGIFIDADRRARLGPEEGDRCDVEEIEDDQQDAGDERAGEQVTDRDDAGPGTDLQAGLAGGVRDGIGQKDQHDRGRDDLAERAGGGDRAGGKFRVIALAQHGRQGDQCHGDDRGADNAGGCG